MLFASCEEDKKKNGLNSLSDAQLKETLIEANKIAAEKEAIQINGFIKRRGWNMKETGTGLRYQVYKENKESRKVKMGDKVGVRYQISLIDGTVCYKTEGDNIDSFKVGNSHKESGLHEAMTYLKEGEKAKIIIPSHLAHGLVGDFNKIPFRSTIIYDLELVSIK